jgi:hypothetical protein
MIIKAEHPFAKYFTIHIDGEVQRPYFQYDTARKIAALGKDETAELLGWDIGRASKAKLLISESYEITPGMFVRDVQADFQLQVSEKCPAEIKELIFS